MHPILEEFFPKGPKKCLVPLCGASLGINFIKSDTYDKEKQEDLRDCFALLTVTRL